MRAWIRQVRLGACDSWWRGRGVAAPLVTVLSAALSAVVAGDGLVDAVALDTNGDGHIDTLRRLNFSPTNDAKPLRSSFV
jgi:hypothetical protein